MLLVRALRDYTSPSVLGASFVALLTPLVLLGLPLDLAEHTFGMLSKPLKRANR
ncbi:hypothetical protein JWV37_00210 [Sulfurospirillum sp. T05]|uniref:Uncharacterized protein n=1 Tax=Sulfurospirillum tamanense TaxID=2813362 RepID=A0ABS2WPP0_9BACT|nr:hypothetical protein [Sulfurospirillum tamanensis]MBN2963189.1 hypothetical protein [Sulfurospirillum tamanensis]